VKLGRICIWPTSQPLVLLFVYKLPHLKKLHTFDTFVCFFILFKKMLQLAYTAASIYGISDQCIINFNLKVLNSFNNVQFV
jgi:hypothetical protein